MLWMGKGPIYYEVSIYDTDPREAHKDIIEDNWRYQLAISGAGKYEDAYLGIDSEDVIFFADTKEEILRDLNLYVNSTQRYGTKAEDKKRRESMGVPPDPMNMDNITVFDETKDKKFSIAEIKNAVDGGSRETYERPPRPDSEKTFIAYILEDEPKKYVVGVTAPDCVVEEEFMNTNYDQNALEDYGVPEYKVNKRAKELLDKVGKEIGEAPPTLSNTKLVNLTDNPTFTLNNIFGVTNPLQLMQKKPILSVHKAAPQASVIMPVAVPKPVKTPEINEIPRKPHHIRLKA